jgi:hypothetical protein
MKVGDRVKLVYYPEGWEDVAGHVVATDDGWLIVEWNNGEGETYERSAGLVQAPFQLT